MSVPVEIERGNIMTLYIKPMGAVRMTQRGKWKSESAKRYMSYKAEIGWQIRKLFEFPTDAAVSVKIKFNMPIPESYSILKRKRLSGTPHTKKPDIDNLIKGIFDAANGIIWKDDNQVVHVDAKKVYSDEPNIEIEITECF